MEVINVGKSKVQVECKGGVMSFFLGEVYYGFDKNEGKYKRLFWENVY